ncbi:MAG: hypothetical protein MI975_07365 [Cytophagales bacterium]|nr:hypothetical protein [Cytophagales bacterium]
MKRNLIPAILLSVLMIIKGTAQDASRNWAISGKNEIELNMERTGVLPYSDNIEMSGKRVAGIVTYSIDEEGRLLLDREIYFPQLHEFKNSEDSWFHDYRAYLQDVYSDDLLPKLYIASEQFVPGAVKTVSINGMLNFEHLPSKNGLTLCRSLFPSVDERLFIEMWTVTNATDSVMRIKSGNTSLSFENYGLKGKYGRKIASNAPEELVLQPGEKTSFALKIAAKMEGEEFPDGNALAEIEKRKGFLQQIGGSLQLETPNPVLNTLFEFSKIRAAESIYESELGLIHSPGGGRYYVGIWANDQAEYTNPFFPYLGYAIGNESAMNCYRAFAGEINPEYEKIRYSFEIEGLVKPFLKDRGDAAMIAYGAAHYAMALGDEETANELWPLIEWCLEYCNRQLNEEGVVMSESDEMEGRIETGNANLSTSSLYYGALRHAADLARSLKKPNSIAKKYIAQAGKLHRSIEAYFGAKVEGLDTYKYYKEHRHLRHWICLPLVMGINDRKDATVNALFERLWTDNGVHVEKNSENEEISKIFWDRGTLYALRGTFFSGETERSLEKLEQFSEKRLLGNRVPYVVEAFPEGNMAHLSAESALYCRVFIEGLFGIVPTGMRSFKCTPGLPENWNRMALKKIRSFGNCFDLTVQRKNDLLNIEITNSDEKVIYSKSVKKGMTVEISFM